MKVVYIASLAHSGSTVLNLSLGSHPRLVGLGEVHWMTSFTKAELKDEMTQACTCGARAGQCEFWGFVFSGLLQRLEATVEEKYRLIFKAFRKHFGDDVVLVDASKRLSNLLLLHSMPDVELSVLLMIRDVRGFTVSNRDSIPLEFDVERLFRFTRNDRLDRLIHANTSRHPFYLFWKWYIRNRGYQAILQKNQVRFFQLGYDEFAGHPEALLGKLSDFLGVDYHPDMLIPDAGDDHLFLGNPKMFYNEKRASIQYDNRWKQRDDWVVAARLFPQIMTYNVGQVYGNIGGL